jgi:hypothetical protein
MFATVIVKMSYIADPKPRRLREENARMRPSLAFRVQQWIQAFQRTMGAEAQSFGGVVETQMVAGDCFANAAAMGFPRLAASAVEAALKTREGPVALVCTDLVRALTTLIQDAHTELSHRKTPVASWCATRFVELSAAVEHETIRTYLTNSVLDVSGANSELSPVRMLTIDANLLSERVTAVLCRSLHFIFRQDVLRMSAEGIAERRALLS